MARLVISRREMLMTKQAIVRGAARTAAPQSAQPVGGTRLFLGVYAQKQACCCGTPPKKGVPQLHAFFWAAQKERRGTPKKMGVHTIYAFFKGVGVGVRKKNSPARIMSLNFDK